MMIDAYKYKNTVFFNLSIPMKQETNFSLTSNS
jgi:hypothetical protein